MVLRTTAPCCWTIDVETVLGLSRAQGLKVSD